VCTSQTTVASSLHPSLLIKERDAASEKIKSHILEKNEGNECAGMITWGRTHWWSRCEQWCWSSGRGRRVWGLYLGVQTISYIWNSLAKSRVTSLPVLCENILLESEVPVSLVGWAGRYVLTSCHSLPFLPNSFSLPSNSLCSGWNDAHTSWSQADAP
jgi:hypothetical protein